MCYCWRDNVSWSAQLDQYNLAQTPDTRKMAPRNAQHVAVLNMSWPFTSKTVSFIHHTLWETSFVSTDTVLAVLCREVIWPVAWVTTSHDSLVVRGKAKVVMITAFCWAITERIVVIPYRRFGTTYPSNIFFLNSGPLNMGPIGCPETSVRNCHYSLRNNPAERSSHLFRGGSLKSWNFSRFWGF